MKKLNQVKSSNMLNNEMTLEQINQFLASKAQHIQTAFKNRDYLSANQQLLELIQVVPSHQNVLCDLAITEMRLENYQIAYDYLQQAIQYHPHAVEINTYDAMSEVCYFLNDRKQQKHYGRLANQAKKDAVQHEKKLSLPQTAPPKFNPQAPSENIISYSLYGDLPRYCEGAVLNTQFAKEIFPEWTCRFYIDESVPRKIVERLKALGAQIIYVNEQQRQLSGLYWRFFVMHDPQVKRFLVRDADSFLSYKERAAVQAWIDSDCYFHCMHDSYDHVELLLAGMFAGCSGIFPDIEQDIRQFLARDRHLIERVMDQHYLRYCIWPTAAQSILIHDSQGYDATALDFPLNVNEYDENFHIGRIEARWSVQVEHAFEPNTWLIWSLKDQAQRTICEYDIYVESQRFNIMFPKVYTDHLQRGEWYIETRLKLSSVT